MLNSCDPGGQRLRLGAKKLRGNSVVNEETLTCDSAANQRVAHMHPGRAGAALQCRPEAKRNVAPLIHTEAAQTPGCQGNGWFSLHRAAKEAHKKQKPSNFHIIYLSGMFVWGSNETKADRFVHKL